MQALIQPPQYLSSRAPQAQMSTLGRHQATHGPMGGDIVLLAPVEILMLLARAKARARTEDPWPAGTARAYCTLPACARPPLVAQNLARSVKFAGDSGTRRRNARPQVGENMFHPAKVSGRGDQTKAKAKAVMAKAAAAIGAKAAAAKDGAIQVTSTWAKEVRECRHLTHGRERLCKGANHGP